MKKSFLATLCTAFAAVALNSCFSGASDHISDMLDAIPADADLVGVVDIETLMNSAEIQLNGADIILPDYIKNELPGEALNEFDELKEEIAQRGLDISAVGIFASFSGDRDRMFAVWPILDEQKLVGYLENEEDYTETEQGVTYYYSESSWDDEIRVECAINNGYVYFLEDGRYFADIDAAIETLQPFFNAEKTYGSSTLGSHITQGNVGGYAMTMPKMAIRELRREGVPSSIVNALEGASFVTYMNLSDDKLTTITATYNAENKPLGIKDVIGNEIPGLALEAGIDSKLLEYLPQNTIAAYAANVEGTDWDALFDWIADETNMPRSERGVLTMVSSYLNKLGGNIAIGAGFDGGLKTIGQIANEEVNPLNEFTFGAVIQTKPDEATGLIKELSGALDMAEVPYDEVRDGIYVNIPEVGEFYAMAVENNIIAISNVEITGAKSNAISGVDFGKQILGCVIVADKNHKLLQDLGIDYSLEMIGGTTANPFYSEGELRITGSSDNLVTSIVKTVFNVVKNADKIYEDYFAREYAYDYDSAYDYAEEEVAVAEEYYY